jgi:hypothetical protein
MSEEEWVAEIGNAQADAARCGLQESDGGTWRRWLILGSDFLRPFRHAEQIMAMPAQRAPNRRWTEEEFYAARDAAPPGERWELVDGEVLVTPAPHWMH